MKASVSVLREGALAGLLGGLVVVTWFLAGDVLAGAPLRTPRLLAGTLFEGGGAGVAVAAYTLLHFSVFVGIGVAVGLFVHATGVTPGVLLGAVVGLGVLTGVHYGALLSTGSSALDVLPGAQVLAANLLAGIGMTLWLHRSFGGEDAVGPAALAGYPFALRGIVTGMMGAAAVALWFLVLDTVSGRPFFTPAALGSAFFLDARSPDEVRLGVGIVAAYTVLHVAVFAAAGLAFVLVAEWVERSPAFWMIAALGAFLLGGVFLVAAAMTAEWVIGALSWWAVGAGTALAAAAMTGWIWRTHPLLRRRLAQVPADTRV